MGALVLPGLFQMGADWFGSSPAQAPLARALQFVADLLDPYRTPGVLLALAVAAVRAPLLASAAEEAAGRFRPVLMDAALNLGANRGRARRLAVGQGLGAPPSVLVLTLVLAATSLAPALILAPTVESRTVAPAVLLLADGPGADLQRAAVLAICAVAVNLFALALAARRLDTRFSG